MKAVANFKDFGELHLPMFPVGCIVQNEVVCKDIKISIKSPTIEDLRRVCRWLVDIENSIKKSKKENLE